MWTKDRVLSVARSPRFVVAAASAVSLASGLAAGHLLTKRTLETKFNQLLDQEVEAFKEQYRATERGKIQNEVNEEVKRELFAGVVERLGYDQTTEPDDEKEEPEEEAPPVPTRKNVFREVAKKDARDYDYIMAREDLEPGEPYIISEEEFAANEESYTQTQLTYYAGDMTLAEANDADIPDHEKDRVVGLMNLERFGVASNDPNLVYVRNDRLEQDFVIARSEGKYAVEVLGHEEQAHLEHSDNRRRARAPRKFSGHDD